VGAGALIPSLGMKKVGYLAVNTDWGRGAVAAFGEAFKKNGATIEAVEYVGQADTDFYAQLTKFKAAGVDSVVITDDAPKAAKMLQQMKELGLNVKVLVTGGSAWPDSIVQLAGAKAAEGAMFINFFNPYDAAMAGDPEASKAYVEEWKKKGLPWIGVVEGMRGFDAVYVVAKAIETAKEPTAPKIMAALKTLESRGLYGSTSSIRTGRATATSSSPRSRTASTPWWPSPPAPSSGRCPPPSSGGLLSSLTRGGRPLGRPPSLRS
jgi:ABC-type branched-chain amino acid transport systems, periplasmic component